MKKMYIFSLAMLCIGLIVGQGWAADSVRPKDSSGPSDQDREFVRKAAQAGLAEVEAGNLVGLKSSDPEVKRFGTQMVTDHGNANAELASIAKSKGIAVPTEPDSAHQQLAKRLEAMKGSEFDRLYIEEADVNDHKEAVALFTRQASSGQDAELKDFANKTLPTIKHHLEMAQTIAKAKSAKK